MHQTGVREDLELYVAHYTLFENMSNPWNDEITARSGGGAAGDAEITATVVQPAADDVVSACLFVSLFCRRSDFTRLSNASSFSWTASG